MSKHQVLTKEEFNNYKVNQDVTKVIDQYQNRTGLSHRDIKILDFGCGRGRSVLKLSLSGYEAYGVDIDPEPIKNGFSLFKDYGLEAEKILSRIDESCKLPYPDNYFDIIFSEQVIEHVKNIDLFFGEIARVTKSGGMIYHAFPFKYHFTEQHLFMPLVHWLPKNRLRKLAIYFWVSLGREPRWNELSTFTKSQKARNYYLYSITKTYYRSNNFLKNLLKDFGFETNIRNRSYKFKLTHLNSYFPHTTQIIATKSN